MKKRKPQTFTYLLYILQIPKIILSYNGFGSIKLTFLPKENAKNGFLFQMSSFCDFTQCY